VVAAIILSLLGIAAYFIPSAAFHFSATDLRQQQDLGKNNTLLRRKIQSGAQILQQAIARIDLLNAKKERVVRRNAGGTSARAASPELTVQSNGLSAGDLNARVDRIDSIIDRCAVRLGDWDRFFKAVPVCNPLTGDAVISRRFEMEQDPFSGRKKVHLGVDISATPGRTIVATAAGTIALVESSPVWGKRVVIEHGNGYRTVYAHLGSVVVDRGRRVQRGSPIGTVGSTGFATGPHVHYEIWRDGRAVDPERFFYPSVNASVKIMQ
jgi:murein DD-endopeptidase MepM/ murein hydrolase activator NlpD